MEDFIPLVFTVYTDGQGSKQQETPIIKPFNMALFSALILPHKILNMCIWDVRI